MTPAGTLVRPKVIYVMGAGHSGSTVLGVTLGNCDDVFYAGEVEEWLVKAGEPALRGAERTRFWSAVTDEVDGAGLFGAEANRCVERSSAALRIDRWPARRRLRKPYRRVAEELFHAIARVAGASSIVDTSHFPLRARELQKLRGIELHVIFLVRDPQAVVESNLRELSPHEVAERRWRTVTMNAGLWLTQLLSVLVFLRQPRERRTFLRYEQFIADPEGVLRGILRSVDSSAPIPDLVSLSVGTPLQGNRLIRSERIALERSPPPPAGSSLLTKLMQLPWTPVLARMRPAAAPRDGLGPAAGDADGAG
jgi:hypothetical protein